MSLIITFMLEPAKLQMNCAKASGAMNARGDLTQLAVASDPTGGAAPPLLGVPPTPRMLSGPSGQSIIPIG